MEVSQNQQAARPWMLLGITGTIFQMSHSVPSEMLAYARSKMERLLYCHAQFQGVDLRQCIVALLILLHC